MALQRRLHPMEMSTRNRAEQNEETDEQVAQTIRANHADVD